MTSVGDILAELKARGARLVLEDGEHLRVHTGPQPLPSELLARLRTAKAELIEFLTQNELPRHDVEAASSFYDNPPEFAEHEERNSAEATVSCTSRPSCAAGLAPSPEVLGDAPAGERCTLCGGGRGVKRIRYRGEVRLWHPACADRYIASVAHPTVKPADDGTTPLRTMAASPSSSQTTSADPSLEPKRLANGQFLWRFAAGPVTDASPLALMARARNHDVALVRDGNTLIVAARHALPGDLLGGLQRHAGTVLARLSRESAERIARFQRGESGLVTEVFGLDPKGDD